MTENTQARTVVGTMRSLAGTGTGAVRMEDRYDTDIDDLWSALTDPARLARLVGADDLARLAAGLVRITLDRRLADEVREV